jgi:acyl CoA:acetate/3-ketoacid CoA transferase
MRRPGYHFSGRGPGGPGRQREREQVRQPRSRQGGFIDISQTSKKVVFCTYFNTVGFEAAVNGGNLQILQEGKIPKFVDKVDQITFNGKLAREAGKEVLYVTERPSSGW